MPYTPLELAEAFIQTGELQDALDALNQHLDANPVDDAIRRLRAQVLIRLRGEANLRIALADVERLSVQSVSDRLTRAIILEQIGDFNRALEAMAQLHAEDPADEQIAERYFWRLMGGREYAQAAHLLALMPRTSDWLTKAGDLATEDGHQDQAPDYYTEALRLLASEFDLQVDPFAKPIHANLLVSRAQAYANLNQFQEADADYAAAQAVMPDDPLIPFWHSFVLASLGQINAAIEMCRLALTNAPENWKAHMAANLKVLAENPTFAPLAALLDSPTP